ncbi:MAG: hypothetical protein ACRDOH_17755 [Streptosporangiaceae bacterium]
MSVRDRLRTPSRAPRTGGFASQQVSPAASEFGQRGHRGGFLVAAQLARPGAVPTASPRELGDEDPVSLRAESREVTDFRSWSSVTHSPVSPPLATQRRPRHPAGR